MERLREVWARLRGLAGRAELERGLDEEIRFHIEQQTAKNLRDGMAPAEARRAAVLRFGGVERWKEEVRDEVRAPLLEDAARDVRQAVRVLRRSPGFTVVAVLSLALGIGANTAIFSVVDGVLLAPLPFPEPDRLLAVGETTPDAPPGALSVTTPASFFAWSEQAPSLRLAGYWGAEAAMAGSTEPERVTGAAVAGDLFGVLGVRPRLGRPLLVSDQVPEAPRVIVLSDALWRRLDARGEGAPGSRVRLNGEPREVVGVMPPGFSFPDASTEYWLPSRFEPAFRANRDQWFIRVVGRVAPGATLERAQGELDAVADRLRRDWPAYNTDLRVAARPLHETLVQGVRTQLLVVMGAVALVLLIGCANLANLLLARAATRRREMAVRRALGAGRRRIARQLVAESLVLALAGGAAGLLAGGAFLELLLAAQGVADLPRAEGIGLDARVLLFTLGVTLAAGLSFGVLPALHLASGRSSEALREGTRGSAGARGARSALVVAELALAMILLVGAGLLLRSFVLLRSVDPGFEPEGLIAVDVSLPASDPAFFERSLEEIRGLPGVSSAAIVSQLPVTGRGIGAWFNRIDRPLPPGVTPDGEAYRVVSPGYFETVGVPLKRGRLLDGRDGRGVHGLVISESLAREYYPGEDPIGKPVYLGSPEFRLVDDASIVGVVGDTRDGGLGADPIPAVYLAHASMPAWRSFSYVVRTSGPPLRAAPSVRGVIRGLKAELPVGEARTLEAVLAESMAPARWSSTLLGVFAALALATAALGVFGVLSYLVAQRTRELGIRIALGAAPGAVRTMVFGQGFRLILAGIALGGAGAYALTRWMASLLYGVAPTDPATFAGVAATLAVIAALASWLPARRATRVNPMVALRAE